MNSNCEKDYVNKVECAIRCIEYSMRRNKLGIDHMSSAFRDIHTRHVVCEIMRMRAEGQSIRKIARTVHMDDKRVSRIIKFEMKKAVGQKKSKRA